MNLPTVVYTYKNPLYKIRSRKVDQEKWLKDSVESAKSIGYKTEIYTDSAEFVKNINVDKVHFIKDEYQLWDSFKIWVLENREDTNYFLSDYDVIYKSPIEFNPDVDIYFDGWERLNWDLMYSGTIKLLKDKNILDSSYWEYSKKPVMNVGILKINNPMLKTKYIEEWKAAYSKLESLLEEFDLIRLTPILTQYLLTLIVQKENYSSKFFTTNEWTSFNEYYRHFVGFRKYTNTSYFI